MFGFGKKEMFTLDKLFCGYLNTEKKIIIKREEVGFKFDRRIGVMQGIWSNISSMNINDIENLNVQNKNGNLLITETVLSIQGESNHEEFKKLLLGLRNIDFKFSDEVPTPSSAIPLRQFSKSYIGLILPNGDILSSVKKGQGFYCYNVFDKEQIIIQ